ncbi:MAG: cell division inhibitor [Flavobacteriaceae bacterium]|nr:cell division inhibitor [Flavobacteriaceae bacterium]|tara:strand:+ start:13325 stop:13792 length:468 start_codon:yes stop_codon:yes gene_type:complete
MTYRKYSLQKIPISLNKAWIFFSNPNNLKKITPNEMNFKVISGGDKKIFPGQIIEYKVSPLFGFSIKWVSEITHVIEGSYFVDEQRFGPYKFWHHKHFLKTIPGGVEMKDVIDYKLPYGIIGKLLHTIIIRPKLDQIFNYRYNKLIEIFGEFNKT